jgi:ABC-type Fe3+ transport system permease subunit
LRNGFTISDGHFTRVYLAVIFSNKLYRISIGNSILLATLATTIAFLIALPPADFTDRCDFPSQKFFINVILLPIMLPAWHPRHPAASSAFLEMQ